MTYPGSACPWEDAVRSTPVWVARVFITILMLALITSGSSCIILVQSVQVWRYPEYHGYVIDAGTKAPIEGAQVTWLERRLTIATDRAGGFIFPPEVIRKRLT